jgi:hypothetical protein
MINVFPTSLSGIFFSILPPPLLLFYPHIGGVVDLNGKKLKMLKRYFFLGFFWVFLGFFLDFCRKRKERSRQRYKEKIKRKKKEEKNIRRKRTTEERRINFDFPKITFCNSGWQFL